MSPNPTLNRKRKLHVKIEMWFSLVVVVVDLSVFFRPFTDFVLVFFLW